MQALQILVWVSETEAYFIGPNCDASYNWARLENLALLIFKFQRKEIQRKAKRANTVHNRDIGREPRQQDASIGGRSSIRPYSLSERNPEAKAWARRCVPPAPPCCSCGAGLAGPLKLTAAPSSSPSATRLRFSGSRRRRAGVARAGGGGGDGESGKNGAVAFFGEDGVVEDMDGYLDYLSLEYDSVWDTKPVWCQPWTILLSGTVAVACSWVLLQSIVITAGVSFVICAWWYIFLYSYPKAYTEMITERRRKVASGAEDTYGMEKIQ